MRTAITLELVDAQRYSLSYRNSLGSLTALLRETTYLIIVNHNQEQTAHSNHNVGASTYANIRFDAYADNEQGDSLGNYWQGLYAGRCLQGSYARSDHSQSIRRQDKTPQQEHAAGILRRSR